MEWIQVRDRGSRDDPRPLPLADTEDPIDSPKVDHHNGRTMRRFVGFVAVSLVLASWSGSARAQYGFAFGQKSDPNAEIEAARSRAKQQLEKYARPSGPGARGPAGRQAIGGGFRDRFGRWDLAGHPVAGYPTVRGDLDTVQVPRGGANAGRRSIAPRRNARRPR
jgi:hypothetical protein